MGKQDKKGFENGPRGMRLTDRFRTGVEGVAKGKKNTKQVLVECRQDLRWSALVGGEEVEVGRGGRGMDEPDSSLNPRLSDELPGVEKS